MHNQTESSIATTMDDKLANLPLPIEPEELCKDLEIFSENRDPYDFVADRRAKKARECWIASKFLGVHSQQTGRRYQITSVMGEAPDIEYRWTEDPGGKLSIEAAELISPDRKRAEEYLRKKKEREACAKENREYEGGVEYLPQAFLEREEASFPLVAASVLKEKLANDYGANCTLVLCVNLWLFGDEPIRRFAATYQPPLPSRFREIWFLYGREIIPLRHSI